MRCRIHDVRIAKTGWHIRTYGTYWFVGVREVVPRWIGTRMPPIPDDEYAGRRFIFHGNASCHGFTTVVHSWHTSRMARDRTPYTNQRFKDAKKRLRDGWYRCWVTDENGRCCRRGTIPDHYPPISTVPDIQSWHGEYRPMCAHHSRRQSGMLRHGKNYRPEPSRAW